MYGLGSGGGDSGGGIKIRVTPGRMRLEGVGASIKLGRRLGCGLVIGRSRGPPWRRRASSAESRVDAGNTPPIVGCGEYFSWDLGAARAETVFFFLLPFPLSAGSGSDSTLLCFGPQIRPALKRNHINAPPIIRIKIAVAVNTPVASASITCKTSLRCDYQV